MRAIADQTYTLKEYFELERTSEEKWEFWNGHVWCMSGASPVHERIVSNLIVHLRSRLGRRCSVFSSNLKVAVPDFPPYRYPDLSVYCGEGKFEKISGLSGFDVLTNPQMLIEVLSPSTEAFDRGDKFTYYKSIPSLTDYLLVSTTRASVMYFRKYSDNEWSHTEGQGLGASIMLPTFEIEILLSEVYLDVDFPEPFIRNPEEERFM